MSPAAEVMLVASDGVRVHATLTTGPGDVAFVVVHGFSGHAASEEVLTIVRALARHGSVVTVDLRGHGRSEGESTVGMLEVLDVDAAVQWARELGFRRIVALGFSMGAAVVVRHAALARDPEQGTSADPPVHAGVDAVVAVSGPAFWYYRGTPVMRTLHWLVETRSGRALLRLRGTRIRPQEWPDPRPLEPVAAAGMLGPIPLLVVHGTADRFFPLEHPRAMMAAALAGGHEDADVWILEGVGHAEAAMAASMIDEMAEWGLARCSD